MPEYRIKPLGLCPDTGTTGLETPNMISFILQLAIGRDRNGKTGDLTADLIQVARWVAEVEVQKQIIQDILDRKVVLDIEDGTIHIWDAKHKRTQKKEA